MDYFEFGPTPCDEPCAGVGEENYMTKGRIELKGGVLEHLIQNNGNISDSDVRGIAGIVLRCFPDF